MSKLIIPSLNIVKTPRWISQEFPHSAHHCQCSKGVIDGGGLSVSADSS